ncbi:hypothetical protein ACJX0J_011579, partial [Zea mays]
QISQIHSVNIVGFTYIEVVASFSLLHSMWTMPHTHNYVTRSIHVLHPKLVETAIDFQNPMSDIMDLPELLAYLGNIGRCCYDMLFIETLCASTNKQWLALGTCFPGPVSEMICIVVEVDITLFDENLYLHICIIDCCLARICFFYSRSLMDIFVILILFQTPIGYKMQNNSLIDTILSLQQLVIILDMYSR